MTCTNVIPCLSCGLAKNNKIMSIFLGHCLSNKNTLEVKKFDTQLVFICNTFNYKSKISTKPQNADFRF